MGTEAGESGELFPQSKVEHISLARRRRPLSLADYVGQGHILSEGRLLRRAIESDRLFSMILYGPP
ncbi:MAG: hypothetical protein KAI25_01345, partial [Hyphomicrobiaceae bacterium]|nr:hypothetical protein [Hyphomicrobiaceae bacterium]